MDTNNDQSKNETSVGFQEIPESEENTKEPIIPTKHSGLGIASVVLGVLSVVLMILAAVVYFANADALRALEDISNISPDQLTDEQLAEYAVIAVIALMVIAVVLFMVIGFILGMIGLLNKQRKNLYPIIGIVLSICPIIVYVVRALFNMVNFT